LINHRHLPAFEFLTRALTERDETHISGWDKLIRRLGEPVRDPVQALLSGALSHDMAGAKSLQAYLCETEGRDTVLKRELGEPDRAVRVMTVHGAKGLQSPIVILPDTTGATKPVSDSLFFAPDGVPLHSPSSRLDCRATAELREAANIAAERESRRLLYVALTRASDRLIIAGAGLGSSKAGYAKSSWYRWCLTAMRALVEAPIEESAPETAIVFGAPPVRVPPETASEAGTAAPPDWLKRPAATPVPPARLAAPSRLTEDHAAVRAPFGPDRSTALRRGRLIHALLQTLPDLPASDRNAAGARFLGRDPEVTEAEATEMLEVTLRTLDDPGFAEIFAPGGRNEAAIVGALPGGQMVNGRVDRLVISDEQVMIIDYKTDRPAPVQAADVDLSYLVQMAAYRAVLQALFPERPVRCALLYTDGPHLIELDGQAMSESLNRVESRV
jgi:ATP-dependent helicase/nuclease subunit A